jgi:hypothetical protein
VSTEEQAEKCTGLEAQQDAIDAERKRQGWVVEHDADEARAMSTFCNVRKVLQLLASGQGDVIVVTKKERPAINHRRDLALEYRRNIVDTGDIQPFENYGRPAAAHESTEVPNNVRHQHSAGLPDRGIEHNIMCTDRRQAGALTLEPCPRLLDITDPTIAGKNE